MASEELGVEEALAAVRQLITIANNNTKALQNICAVMTDFLDRLEALEHARARKALH